MSEEEFWDCTPRYFHLRQRAYVEREEQAMERLRTSTYLICGPYLKKGTTLKRFWPLPWDKIGAAAFEPADPAEMKKFEAEARKIFEQMGVLPPQMTNGNHQ